MKNFSLLFLFGLLFLAADVHGQKDLSIAKIQGETNTSQHIGENVRVTGVVTARIRSGFFIQTPDDKQDASQKSSDGIFIFTKTGPPEEAAVGNMISVTGTIEEFRRDNEPLSLTVTEVSVRVGRDEVRVISKSNPLPKPVTLSPNDFMPNSVDQLERYEGMRVQIDELTVVGPTGGRIDAKTGNVVSDGAFYAVLKPVPRPFRELGMDIREYLNILDKDKFKQNFPKISVFDSNPEIIRIDCDEQIISKSRQTRPDSSVEEAVTKGVNFSLEPLNVAAYSDIRDVTGVLHYSNGKYSVLLDVETKPLIVAPLKPAALVPPGEREFAVAGMNLENFFDDLDDPAIKEDIVTTEVFERRLKKLSMAIREFMRMPDVIGIIEAENIAALKRLAERLNSDTIASGKPDPKYQAYLIDGNDGRGIDNGFLVKTSRVRVLEIKQFGKDEKYKNPNTKADNFLNDRTPLMLRASIDDPKSGAAFEFTVVANHLKSFLGYNDPKQQDNVRLKKRLQAEFLAKLVQERQKANPKERIILVGDFNAFQFNDGIVDVIGTITGKPALKTETLNPSEDFVNPDLIDLVDVIDRKQRYSYSFDGNAQVLDHIIINEALRKHTKGFGYARINVDFPEIVRNDPTRYERFSDHDPAVAYFTFDDLTIGPRP